MEGKFCIYLYLKKSTNNISHFQNPFLFPQKRNDKINNVQEIRKVLLTQQFISRSLLPLDDF